MKSLKLHWFSACLCVFMGGGVFACTSPATSVAAANASALTNNVDDDADGEVDESGEGQDEDEDGEVDEAGEDKDACGVQERHREEARTKRESGEVEKRSSGGDAREDRAGEDDEASEGSDDSDMEVDEDCMSGPSAGGDAGTPDGAAPAQ